MIRKPTHSQVAHDCQPESGYFQQISLSCSKTKASQFFEIVMSRGPLLFAPFVFSVLLSLTLEVTSLRSSSVLWSLLNIMDCKQILSIFYGIMCGLVVVLSDCQAIHLFSPTAQLFSPPSMGTTIALEEWTTLTQRRSITKSSRGGNQIFERIPSNPFCEGETVLLWLGLMEKR